LKGRNILITAGPTWVAIDSVRVISNTATGENGSILANELAARGAKVTLLLGPAEGLKINKKVKVLRFKFFGRLKELLLKEIRSDRYDCLIHSAAVSDYLPAKAIANKTGSGKKAWNIRLVPAPKLINLARKAGKRLFLVGFKFEPGLKKSRLIEEAEDLQKRSGADMVVANNLSGRSHYQAYILGTRGILGKFDSKKTLVKAVSGELKRCL